MERIEVSNIKINPVQIPQVIKIMSNWINEKSFGNYIVIANAYDFFCGIKSKVIRESMNSSSLTVPDGFSLLLFCRLYGYPLKKRVCGPDLMAKFLEFSQKRGYSHFFYGSTEKVLQKLEQNIRKTYPKIRIVGKFSPPFRNLTSEEKANIIEMINHSKTDVLWVGLGCPKQQLWMYENRDKIHVPIMLGVGAAFDFLANTKPRAPKWMQDKGLEWLFRLTREPQRLWSRYLVGNIIFVGILLKELVKKIIGYKD